MTTTTRRARPWHLLLIPILVLPALACQLEPETRPSRLADLEPSPSAEDKARSESSEPLPLPQEPAPWATPDDVRPAARLLDVDPPADDASRALAASAEPAPIPEEPRPARTGKKAAR